MTGRLLATALVGLTLAGASACGEAAPVASGLPAASAGAGDSKAVCEAVMKARQTALEAFTLMSAGLAKDGQSADDVAKATHNLRAAFNALHFEVAAAAERADDPELKAKLAAYQLAVEQAIVVVEGADGDRAQLAAAIELPEMRSAEQAVMAACA